MPIILRDKYEYINLICVLFQIFISASFFLVSICKKRNETYLNELKK